MIGTEWRSATCPECKGDRQAHGLLSPEPCPGCGGLGFIWVIVRRPKRHGIIGINGTTS